MSQGDMTYNSSGFQYPLAHPSFTSSGVVEDTWDLAAKARMILSM